MAETDHIRFADKHIRNCAQSFALQTIAFTLNMFALSMNASGKRPEIPCRHPLLHRQCTSLLRPAD